MQHAYADARHEKTTQHTTAKRSKESTKKDKGRGKTQTDRQITISQSISPVVIAPCSFSLLLLLAAAAGRWAKQAWQRTRAEGGRA
jgi:hypothetical protein